MSEGELGEGEIVGGRFVVPRRHTSELLEFADQALDPVALLVGPAVAVGVVWLVHPVWDDRDDLLVA
jgi:hypothetical protein